MIFSPEDQGITFDLSPALSISSMDTESESERTPRATLRMYNLFMEIADLLMLEVVQGSLFDTPMDMDDGEVEPGYGRMSQIRRFKLDGTISFCSQ